MNNNWTYRVGEITEKDKLAIRGMTQVSTAACQIFLTGEVMISRIGEVALSRLSDFNDAVDEPIIVFSNKDWGTAFARMTRFDASKVWPLLGTDLLHKLIREECGWLGVKPFVPEVFDFYEALFQVENLFDTYTTAGLDDSLYLNALTVFSKPLLGDIPASTFFSSAPSLTAGRATMSESMLAKRDKVWDKSKQRLTNAELEFLVNMR